MKRSLLAHSATIAGAGLLLITLAAGTSPLSAQGANPPSHSHGAAGGPVGSDSVRPRYTAADVRFMQGMIHHHAQAVLIAGWAPSHGASDNIRVLCNRIVVSQNDEIGTMQRWLREHNETVPEADTSHMAPSMAGMQHHAMMPGMLSPAQLTELDRARGTDFDRLFLMFMIQHHRGALTMVDELFGSPGAAQDDFVYKLASDMSADQSTEIDRMTKMLLAVPFSQ